MQDMVWTLERFDESAVVGVGWKESEGSASRGLRDEEEAVVGHVLSVE